MITASADFNPRSPHGERHGVELEDDAMKGISTHAPRTGSDCKPSRRPAQIHDFNPRSPHGERHLQYGRSGETADFNPRSPHGERPGQRRVLLPDSHFNPRSPHGERQARGICQKGRNPFQPTLPARGATRTSAAAGRQLNLFQPTLPARGATALGQTTLENLGISTHAPRTGSDSAK